MDIDQVPTVGEIEKDSEVRNHDKSTNYVGNKCKLNAGRTVLLLINPHSGRGKSVDIYRKKILPVLNSNSIDHETFITKKDDRVKDFLNSKSSSHLAKYKSILVVSGDGLLFETVNSLMSRKDWEKAMRIPIGIVPTGSGNGLAYTLLKGVKPDLSSTDDAIGICLDQALGDATTSADLVKISYGKEGATTTIWSFLSLGWGLLADIDVDSNWLRRLGELRFTIYGLLRSVTSRSYRGRLSYKLAQTINRDKLQEIKNEETNSTLTIHNKTESSTGISPNDEWVHIEDKFACLYAVYQSHVSRATNFAPRSTLTDQVMYVTYIRGKLSTCRIIEFLLAIDDGSHEKLSYVRVVPVTEFMFQPTEQSKIVIDGEKIEWKLDDGPITAKVLPKILNLSWTRPT